MTKVISILGSPRKKGTSARIAKAFTDTAQQMGAQVDFFYLNGMGYKGCQACEQCHTKLDRCVLDDDLKQVLDGMHTADAIVFSAPVYYADVSGQFKLFLDRTWSLVDYNPEREPMMKSRLPHGKTALFILSQGDVAESHQDIPERYKPFFNLCGFDLKIIRAAGLFSGEPDADVSAYQEEAIKAANAFMGNR